MIREILDRYTINDADEKIKKEARELWNGVMKPLGSFGEMEELIVKLAGIYGNIDFEIGKRCVTVVCADNGVVREGVSQSGSHVTRVVAEQMARGRSNINVCAMTANADVYVADLGMLEAPAPDMVCGFEDVSPSNDSLKESIIDLRVDKGTRSIAEGPAMTEAQAAQAVENGIKLTERMKHLGYDIIVTGEMGIGNSTTSSALCSVLLGKKPSEVTGRGAGLEEEALKRKISIIEKAVEVNGLSFDRSDGQAEPDPFTALVRLGGFDIAAMAGIFIGGAVYRLPIVIDGFISAAAALIAYKLERRTKEFMLPSHLSAEGPVVQIMDELGMKPVINAGMRLGEGTGGVCLLPLLDIALAEFKYSHRFADTDVEQYKNFI